MFPELVQSLIDWYKWRYKWVLLNYKFRSLRMILNDESITIWQEKNVYEYKRYNWRKLNGGSYGDNNNLIHYSNECELSRRYIYTSGFNTPNGYN